MIAILKEKIIQVLKTHYPASKLDFSLTPEEKFGDYSTNAALKTGKEGVDSREVAEKLAAELAKDKMFSEVTVAGPGFINFKIALPYLHEKIIEILKLKESYGNSDLGQDLSVNIEFISANPTGPLTLGNGRGGYGGDCLAKVLEAFGAKVEREYYINDRGGQILALGHSVLKDQERVYQGEYIDELADKIKSADPQTAGQEAAAILMEESIKKTIQRMGIAFDHFSPESHLFRGLTEEVMGILVNNQLTYKDEGALFLKTSQYGDDKDRALITSKGEFTYFAADLAYHYLKIKRGYNVLIDIWGADHHGYIDRMKAGVGILEKEQGVGIDFRILVCQLVRLISFGKEIKMSKRAGTYVTLDELIDEVGSDVARFFFLERSFDTHMDFDLDLAKEKSQKNPVYYVQYAYARVNSILAKSAVDPEVNEDRKIELIKESAEIALIKELIKLPDIIIEIAANYQIQRLPQYALRLATSFHNFYEQCRVISEDQELTKERLTLILATKIVLKKTLDLMGVSAPEKM